MKKVFSLFAALILGLLPLNAIAESIPLALRITETVDSETLDPKTGINAEIVSDVIVNGETLFKKGSYAKLYTKNVTKRARMGKGGYIEARKGIITDINGNEHLVTTRLKVQGLDKDWVIPTVTFCAITIILSPVSLVGLKKGYSAVIEEGTTVDAVLER